MEIFSIKRLFGFGLFVELLETKASDFIIETTSTDHDREVWLFGRLHLVISNEKAYSLS
ncbi:hypothetical protein [Methylophaga sulfidovorans]|uniref:hypothetical protein n=1 Tax=Methylophaga sulfidovorans TaxID=45496 RepID=UPI0015A5A9AB|nr:hypothetical protein [Methylophaga sulfidovorans]